MKSIDLDELLRRNPKINRQDIEAFVREKLEQPGGKNSGGGWPVPFGGRRRRTVTGPSGSEMRRQPSNHRRQS
jgi:hypothetical protein